MRGKRVASHLRSTLQHRPTTIAEHMPSSHGRFRGRARVDTVANLLEMLFGDQGTHLGFGNGAGADVQRARLWSQDFDQAFGSCLGDRDCY